jgi:hypothetical protein
MNNCCKICKKKVDLLGGKYICINLWDCDTVHSERLGDLYCHYECFREAPGDDYIRDLENSNRELNRELKEISDMLGV